MHLTGKERSTMSGQFLIITRNVIFSYITENHNERLAETQNKLYRNFIGKELKKAMIKIKDKGIERTNRLSPLKQGNKVTRKKCL
jgi:hypothetical protein